MDAKDIALMKKLGGGGSGGGLPSGGTPYQQLVTDGDGNAKWEDRLAYVATEEQVIFSQENIEFKNLGDRYGYEIESPFGEIVIGQKYTVVWDGVTYPDLVAFDYGVQAIGAPDGNFTDELPFTIYTYDDAGLLVGFETLSVESTHSVTIFGPFETVHKIQQKWLPEKTKVYVRVDEGLMYFDSERTRQLSAEDFISAVNSGGIDFIKLPISSEEVHLQMIGYKINKNSGTVIANIASVSSDGSTMVILAFNATSASGPS